MDSGSRQQQSQQYDPAQLVLDFSSRLDDRRRQLRAALKRLTWPDLRCWSLLLWVLHVETEHAGLVRDYEELADALWCDRSTVIRTVNRLLTSELIVLGQTFDKDGAARKNEYRLNWSRIAALASQSAVELGAMVVGRAGNASSVSGVPSQIATTQSHFATTQWQNATSYKDTVLSGISGPEDPYSGSGGSGSERPPKRKNSPDSEQVYKPPAEVPDELLRRYPLLAEAKPRRLSELPAEEYFHGVFKPLETEHLASLQRMIDWHRRQLASAAPVLAGSEAELLLTVAACRLCHDKRQKVLVSRLALFIHTISKRLWLDVVPYLPAARECLDSHAEKAGGVYWLVRDAREA